MTTVWLVPPTRRAKIGTTGAPVLTASRAIEREVEAG